MGSQISGLYDSNRNKTDLEVHYLVHPSHILPNLVHARTMLDMARGWESKSVEEQQAEAATRRQPASKKLSPQEAVQVRQLEGLRLSRQRVLQQLQNAHDSRLRQMLEQALADLDRRIETANSQ